MKAVVVTGVSTGIGLATAQVLLAKGFHVFGSVRREADMARLKLDLGVRFTPLLFDITDPEAVAKAAAFVESMLGGEPLAGLVNNAGIAVAGPLLHVRVEDFRHQLDVNLTGQLIVIQAFAPLLDGAHPGRVVMISSVSGRNAAPFAGPYAISKFGLEAMAEALRREMMVFGIDVIVIAPGPIATPIWDKTGTMDSTHYADTVYAEPLEKVRARLGDYASKALAPEKVGALVVTALTAAHPQTRYEITPEPVSTSLLRLLPKRWADRLYAKALGLKRRG